MRVLLIDERQADKRIDRVIVDIFPHMPASAMYKAFRKKDIKVNGIRVKEDYIVNKGDRLEVYIVDKILEGMPKEENHKLNKGFSVIYEDRNLVIVNKEQGIAVHPDRDQQDNTLIDFVKLYLTGKGEYNPDSKTSFAPSLCHRLDRNTGGLVIIAKNSEALKAMMDKIKNKEIKKYYQCLVKGKMEREQAELKAYLEKDENRSRVFINNTKAKGALEIITRYRTLSYESISDISRLEVELVTGRTHQIRAHLAFIGHPVIGDGKYGTNSVNRAYKTRYQALWACKVIFDFRTGSGILDYLNGRKFEVEPGFKINAGS